MSTNYTTGNMSHDLHIIPDYSFEISLLYSTRVRCSFATTMKSIQSYYRMSQ